MESISPTTLGVYGLAAALLVLLANALRFKVDPREPPVIYPSIPLIGHIIGAIREGSLYASRIHRKHKHPIFTMPMLTGRTYIVAEPALCTAVQKATSTMDFDRIVAEMLPRLIGLNDHTTRIIRGPPGQKMDSHSIVQRSHHVINPPLMPKSIHGVSQTQLDYFSSILAKIEDGSELDLFRFTSRAMTTASMATFFGPDNPFERNPELLDKFWDWEAGIVAYMTGVLPSVFARKAARGLEACVQGFQKYVEEKGHDKAYILLQDRHQLHLEQGITDSRELAKLEVAFSLAINVNASGTTFWMVDQIFSRPELLSKIREEISANALVSHGVLSAMSLRQACPRLNSAWREAMRLFSPSISARLVNEDTLLVDTWLLRKGAIVQLSGAVIHHDSDIWGPDVDTFNPDRFLYSMNGSRTNPDGTVPEGKDHFIHSAAFRSFGGGVSLCPGRHFAHIEILGLAATLIMGFDLEPIHGTTWSPPADVKRVSIATMKPTAPLDVRVTARKEFAGVRINPRYQTLFPACRILNHFPVISRMCLPRYVAQDRLIGWAVPAAVAVALPVQSTPTAPDGDVLPSSQHSSLRATTSKPTTTTSYTSTKTQVTQKQHRNYIAPTSQPAKMIKTILLIIITIFFPPVGVFLVAGCGADLLINILLTILGYFPGHVHAFYIEYVYYKRRDEIRAGTYDGSNAPGVYSTKVQHGGQKNVAVQPAPVAGDMPPAQQGYGTATV
ncbi:hypothetical protein OPT61_g3452 [Boeremia exigua]|uniref:Uncharacterized protein n=1 Tax=Boeremia exigua TaxID=749465 RepID=A0ACC2IHR3_9PLEO|nr:hypothetical protein OPT61_g3452 [Boeremia exigua]